MTSAHDKLAVLFDKDDDPWRFRTRWYEARKRELTLACLPAARYSRAYEPGCANGELMAALAPRCDHLLGTDGVEAAVELARERVAGSPQVQVRAAWLPQQWPEERFDLIVFSEMGFYLERDALSELVARLCDSLTPHGTVLACHWRHAVEGFALRGDEVHALLDEQLGRACFARLLHHEERDFLLDVWSGDARSVAQREGFAP